MKTYRIIYTEDFLDDVKEAVVWYDAISDSITDKLLAQIRFAELRITRNPNAFSKVSYTGFRRYLMKKFPYKIFFRVHNQQVVMTAFIHSARSDKYVKRKLKKV